MISYEDALKKAKERRPDLNLVVEYENGYVFSSSEDAGYIGGMDHSPVVILKKNGDYSTMIDFINSGTGKEIGRKTI